MDRLRFLRSSARGASSRCVADKWPCHEQGRGSRGAGVALWHRDALESYELLLNKLSDAVVDFVIDHHAFP